MEIQKFSNQFKNFLLTDETKKNIAKVILFGSQAKNTASPDSDIDILIFLNDRQKTQERKIMNHVYDFMVEHNSPIEVITAHVNELAFRQDYFTYNIMAYGVEIYSMEKTVIKQHMVKNILNLCNEYLESAKDVLSLNHIRLSIDGAYNATELAAKALILLKKDDLPGSHGGVASLFGQLYVITNEIDREVGRSINMALKLRNEARYKPDAVFSKEDAYTVLDLAETLINFAKTKINEE